MENRQRIPYLDALKMHELSHPFSYENIFSFCHRYQDWPILLSTTNEKTDTDESSCLYRCRINEDTYFYKKISDVSYTPAEYVRSFGRANRPGQSVFYCADTEVTCFMELIQHQVLKGKKNVRATISKWKVKKPFEAVTIVIPEIANRKNFREIQRGEFFDQEMQKRDSKLRAQNILDMQFLSEVFSDSAQHNPYHYVMTSALANFLVVQSDSNGIIYPSVRYLNDEDRGFIYALDINLIDSGVLSLDSVYQYVFNVEYSLKTPGHFIETDRIFAKSFSVEDNFIEW